MSDRRVDASPYQAGEGRRPVGDWPAEWFAADGAARLVVQRDLRILAANRCAEQILEGGGGLAQRDGALAARDRRSATALSNAIGAAARQPRSIVVGGEGAGAILVEAVALGDAQDSAVAIMLRDLSADVAIECADLEPMFGVTPGEHQVIVRLLQGR